MGDSSSVSETPLSAAAKPWKTWKRGLVLGGSLLATLVAAVVLLGVFYRPDLEIPPGRRGEHVDVDGCLLRVYQTGAGPDLLLIHGCPGSIEDWDAVVDALARDFRVTMYDRPGHGYSGWEGDQYSYEYHAGVALRLIERLQLKDVVVVGHSYGGTTALAVALRKPATVKGVVVLDSAAYELMEKPSALYHVLAVPVLGTGIVRLSGPLFVPDKIRQGLLAQFPGTSPPAGFVELRAEIWNQPKVSTSIARESVNANAESAALSPRYARIALPVHIAAQADHAGRRATAERLAREIPGAQLTLLGDTGHYLQFQKAPEVIELIRRAVR